MSVQIEYGRLWFSPWLVTGSVDAMLDTLFASGLSFGGDPEITMPTGRWIEVSAIGRDVSGLLLDREGLIADPDAIIEVMDPLLQQNVPLTLRGIQYEAASIVNSTMILNRVGGVLSCSIERVRTHLATGSRQVLLNCSAETGRHANVVPLRAVVR